MSEMIHTAVQISSLIVALLAIVIGLRNESRNQRRFELQLSQSREVSRAAVRPLLAVEREGYEDVKALTIVNHGPGTAIISVIKFVRGKKEATDIGELIKTNEDEEVVWNESTEFVTPYYIPAKSKEDALRITDERLRECGIAEKRIEPLLADIEGQLDKISIFVEYQDVFGTSFKLEEVA
jgi:hypothetical protein